MAALSGIMTEEVFTVATGTAVTQVAEAMVRGRFGSALVMSGPMLIGILTERDVLRAASSGADLSSSPASKWMTPDPVTAPPDLDSEEAAETMLTHGFRHLPVVDGGRVVGIVSLRDLLSAHVRRRR
ncbi:MAG: CBS domain-containing protein [Acidimicrobiales bacterium]